MRCGMAETARVDLSSQAVGALSGAAVTSAAGVLLFDERDRLLLVEPTYKPGFEVPGGIVEDGESPWQACVREVREELSLALAGPARLLVTDWTSPVDERIGGLRWLFDGGRLSAAQIAAIRLPEDELRSAVFVTADEAAAYLPPVRARRVLAALGVRTGGTGTYLEDGHPPGR